MTTHYSQLGKVGESRLAHSDHVGKMVDYYRRTASNYKQWHCNCADDVNHNYALKEVLELLHRHKDYTLLDIACGTGRCVAAALKGGFKAQGVDLSRELLDIAEKEFKVPPENLHCADATQLPFPDNSFDICCMTGALHHSAMPHTMISEMIRVTRHILVISDEANHLHGGVREILMSLGIFNPVYRLLFKREPRTSRRGATSEGDGPTFDFTLEEIMPALKRQFAKVRFVPFYRILGRPIHAPFLPRLFATQGVIIAEKKLPAAGTPKS